WLVMLGPWFAPLQAKSLLKNGCPFRVKVLVFSTFPMILLTTCFLIYWGLLQVPGLGNSLWGWVSFWNALMVVYVAPNLVRMCGLQVVYSSIHYFADCERLQDQTQVLNAWYWFPLQAFCFNFGATHALHHILPGQPFYIRQWIASKVYPLM